MSGIETWLKHLHALVARFPEYGASADLDGMSTTELWGLYRFLVRVSDGGERGAK